MFGNSAGFKHCTLLTLSVYLIVSLFVSSKLSSICSLVSFLINSLKNLPGITVSPSKNTSALIVLIIASSKSVADKTKLSFSALSLMPSKIGFVVLLLVPLITFSTASDKSKPSQTNFIMSSPV